MYRTTWVVLAALLIQSGTPVARADYPAILAAWVVTRPPGVGDSRWLAANSDTGHEWVVFLSDRRPSVRPRSVRRERDSPYPERQESYPRMPFAIPRGTAKDGLAGEWFSTRVADGWLIGFNAGEFGSALWWFSPNGTERYRVSDDQVVGFYTTATGLLALEGIAHGTTSRGRVIRLVRGPGGRWQSVPFTDLGGAPEAAVLSPDGFLTVATHERLVRVHATTGKLDVLLSDAFWGGLYPNSLAVAPSGTVYIGMRHGVARVEKAGAGYEARWLLPSREFDRGDNEGFR